MRKISGSLLSKVAHEGIRVKDVAKTHQARREGGKVREICGLDVKGAG